MKSFIFEPLFACRSEETREGNQKTFANKHSFDTRNYPHVVEVLSRLISGIYVLVYCTLIDLMAPCNTYTNVFGNCQIVQIYSMYSEKSSLS